MPKVKQAILLIFVVICWLDSEAEINGYHRRRSDRRRVCVFLQCVWREGDVGRDAAPDCAGRGRGRGESAAPIV